MQIAPINQDNTNFKALHVSKQSLKAMSTSRRALLKNPMIKEAADKYEVLVKPSKNFNTKTKEEHKSSWWLMTGVTAIIGGVLGGLIGIPFAITSQTWLPVIIPSGLLSILFFSRNFINPSIRNFQLDIKEVGKSSKILVQCGEKFENENLTGIKGEKYEISKPNQKIPNIASLLSKKIYEAKFGTLDVDNLFTPEKYLAMLKSYTPTAENFNKVINEKGDTLLTQFFDVVKEENIQDYQQIINILKNIKGLDFNQKGSGNITCLEKIMNSENSEVLPLIKNFEFNYSPELEFAYSNIQDRNFKEKITKLNIKFNDIIEAVEAKSDEALKRLEPQLDSPLCNREKLAKDIQKTLKEMKDPVYENWFKSIYTKYMNTGNVNLID